MSNDTNTDRRMMVSVDWVGKYDMQKGLQLSFCQPGTFRAEGSIDFDGTAIGKFEGTLRMVVLQSDIAAVIEYFGVRNVQVGIDDTPIPSPRAIAQRDELWAKLDVLKSTIKFGESDVRIQEALKPRRVDENLVIEGEQLGFIVQLREAQLLRIPNFGRKCLNNLKDTLTAMGLSLEMDTMGWVPPTDPSRTGQ